MDGYCTPAISEVMEAAQAGAQPWQKPSALLPLPENTLHVWRLLPEARLTSEEYVPYLQPEEHARAKRLLFTEDQQQAIATRGTLRILLAHYAGAAHPGSLEFNFTEQGKPSLSGSDLRFNLSHTRDLAIFAFARGIELGVDVERVRETGDLDDVARQNFAPAECAALFALPSEGRVAAFYCCWTRKEALLKAEGSGLFRALDSFEVSLNPGNSGDMLPNPPAGWEIAHLDVLPDAPGAVAWWHGDPAPQIRLLDLSPSLLRLRS